MLPCRDLEIAVAIAAYGDPKTLHHVKGHIDIWSRDEVAGYLNFNIALSIGTGQEK